MSPLVHECRTSRRHRRWLRAANHRVSHRCTDRLEQQDADVWDRGEHGLDERLDVGPIEATKPTAEGRNRDRTDVATTNLVDQRDEAGLDVLDQTPGAPVSLRREVDTTLATASDRNESSRGSRL
jgi:hypothetical protein